MNKDQLDGLITLKMVSKTNSFSKAADVLGISHSAVSQIIKALETRVGITLISRTTRSISLTEAGQRFLANAGPAIDQILSAFEDIGTFADRPSGVLRINLPRLVYPHYLAPVVRSFLKKYPELTIDLCFQDGKTDIVGEGFDAGIRLSDILIKDMVAIKLFGPVTFVVAGSPKYFKKNVRPKTPQDLLTHNCIRVNLGNYLYDKWEFEQRGKEFEVQVKGNLIMNDSFLAISTAIAGEGLIYTSKDSIADQINSNELEIVLESFASTSSGFYLYYPKQSQVMPKLRAFIDHVKAEKIKRN